MLLASRLDAMKQPERQEDLDLLALVAEEAAHFGREVTGTALHVTGDPNLLRRMIRNLLDNAQRHASGASRIEVEAASAGRVRIIVEDAGPGVAADQAEAVFEPFHRITTSAGEPRGTGLGLSIVRQVARAHGGEVSCEPAGGPDSGPGARFVVTLPVREAAG
jgi:signal transduction histidine kinase